MYPSLVFGGGVFFGGGGVGVWVGCLGSFCLSWVCVRHDGCAMTWPSVSLQVARRASLASPTEKKTPEKKPYIRIPGNMHHVSRIVCPVWHCGCGRSLSFLVQAAKGVNYQVIAAAQVSEWWAAFLAQCQDARAAQYGLGYPRTCIMRSRNPKVQQWHRRRRLVSCMLGSDRAIESPFFL
jgi:hypothetical protein